MMVEDLGMTLISSHAGFKKEEKTQVIDAHLELGAKYVVYPWMSMPETPSGDDYLRKAELFNELGEACRKDGLRFGYHNHDFEFKAAGSATGFDILLQNTSPEQVCFEADLYWMIYAGVDPMLYFNQYSGRFELWHVKDMEDSPERGFAEVGEGKIGYGRYFKEAEPVAGMKYFFVEQDTCKKDPLDSVRISYDNLIKLL
jgi:sugar phosphate isomerase/epimerase